MGIDKAQYNRILKSYELLRAENRREEIIRREEIYEKLPEYSALDAETASFSVGELKRRLKSLPEESSRDLGEELLLLKEKKKKLLREAGYPEDYLEPVYTCPLCKDTGFVDGSPCKCFKEKELQALMDGSRLKTLCATENFSALSYSYHQGKGLVWFKKAVERAKAFVRNFSSEYRNLLFFGTVGTGKTFLSCCIAQALMQEGHSVRYYQASEFFDALADQTFGRQEEGSEGSEQLSECELLILDDLGSEMLNQFTSSALFELLNRRFLRQEPIIISTNLYLQDLRDRYSDRIFSRIISGFEVIELTGEDIRIQKLHPGGLTRGQ